MRNGERKEYRQSTVAVCSQSCVVLLEFVQKELQEYVWHYSFIVKLIFFDSCIDLIKVTEQYYFKHYCAHS